MLTPMAKKPTTSSARYATACSLDTVLVCNAAKAPDDKADASRREASKNCDESADLVNVNSPWESIRR